MVLFFVLLSATRADFDLVFGLAVFFVFFATVFFLAAFFGFRPTLALPAAVFGPGFFAAPPVFVAVVLLVRFAVVRPVCAFGLPTGFDAAAAAAAAVAYERVEAAPDANNLSYDDKDLTSLSLVEELTRASHGL